MLTGKEQEKLYILYDHTVLKKKSWIEKIWKNVSPNANIGYVSVVGLWMVFFSSFYLFVSETLKFL